MQYEFEKSVELHRTKMLESEKQMRSYEKQLDVADEGNSKSDDCSEDSETNETEHVAKRTVQQESEPLKISTSEFQKKQKKPPTLMTTRRWGT